MFTVSGYGQELEEQLIEFICDNGGIVVDFNSSRLVNFSIVSFDAKGVFPENAVNYVTYLYLEDCIEQEVIYIFLFVWVFGSRVIFFWR